MDNGHQYLKLGSVTFEHKDYLRSMLVGIAPFFVGLGFFFFMFGYDIFPSDTLWVNILSVYLLYSVSSSMFSSKKDLEGAIIIIPLVILIISMLIGFHIDVSKIFFSDTALAIMGKLNLYLLVATVGNSLVFILLKLLRV